MTTASSAGSRTQRTQRSWALSQIPFFCKGFVGHMVCDTGAEVSIVTSSFAVAAGLTLIPRAAPRYVRTPAGRYISTATTTLPLTIQLMLDCGGALVHWDRSITLCDVWVVNFGGPSPLDLFVSFGDWDPAVRPDGSYTPLGQLAHLVLSGVTVLDSRRVPSSGTVPVEVKVVHARDHAHVPASTASSPSLRRQRAARRRSTHWRHPTRRMPAFSSTFWHGFRSPSAIASRPRFSRRSYYVAAPSLVRTRLVSLQHRTRRS